MLTLNTTFRKSATMTPSKFLKLCSEHPERVESARMIPPRIGKDTHFGRIKVVFVSGRYEVAR